jgi:hypothetical protein
MFNKLVMKVSRQPLHNSLFSKQISRCFSSQNEASVTLKELHTTKHLNSIMDPKFYEKDFWSTGIEEIEFVRSPFYDLAKNNMFHNDEVVHQELEELGLKFAMIDDVSQNILYP